MAVAQLPSAAPECPTGCRDELAAESDRVRSLPRHARTKTRVRQPVEPALEPAR